MVSSSTRSAQPGRRPRARACGGAAAHHAGGTRRVGAHLHARPPARGGVEPPALLPRVFARGRALAAPRGRPRRRTRRRAAGARRPVGGARLGRRRPLGRGREGSRRVPARPPALHAPARLALARGPRALLRGLLERRVVAALSHRVRPPALRPRRLGALQRREPALRRSDARGTGRRPGARVSSGLSPGARGRDAARAPAVAAHRAVLAHPVAEPRGVPDPAVAARAARGHARERPARLPHACALSPRLGRRRGGARRSRHRGRARRAAWVRHFDRRGHRRSPRCPKRPRYATPSARIAKHSG